MQAGTIMPEESTEAAVDEITQFRKQDDFIKIFIDLLFGESHNRTIHVDIISAGKIPDGSPNPVQSIAETFPVISKEPALG